MSLQVTLGHSLRVRGCAKAPWGCTGRGVGRGARREQRHHSPEHNSSPIRAALEPRGAATNKALLPQELTALGTYEQGQGLWCSRDPPPPRNWQDSNATQTNRSSYLNVCLTAFTRRSMIFRRSSREQLRSSVLSGFKSRAVTLPSSSISRTMLSDLQKGREV